MHLNIFKSLNFNISSRFLKMTYIGLLKNLVHHILLTNIEKMFNIVPIHILYVVPIQFVINISKRNA